MASAEKALFSITNMDAANDKSPNGLSEREKKLRLAVNFRPVSLKEILQYISIQDMDPELKKVLTKQVSRYPHAALQHFADNFEQMVNVAQRKIRKTYIIEPATAAPLDPDSMIRRPSGQYNKNKVEPKLEPRPVVKAKKIDLSDVDFSEDMPSDLLETPVESLDGIPVTVQLAVNVNNVRQPIVTDESQEEERKPMPPPKPQPKPTPPTTPPQPKLQVFSATLRPEDFE